MIVLRLCSMLNVIGQFILYKIYSNLSIFTSYRTIRTVKIIFAQGNPGLQYSTTRHNVGFQVLDFIASKETVAFQSKTKFNADIAEVAINGEKVLLVKPMTFYNDTGVSARTLLDFYKLDSRDILVIHDELKLPFGKIRVRHSGRDAGNNGIKSLNLHITEQYPRIRIGIGKELEHPIGDADFVLAPFTNKERSVLTSAIYPEATRLVSQFLDGTLASESITVE